MPRSKKSKSHIVLHIPHSSRHIPEDVKADFVIDGDDLEAELNRVTDHATDELFELEGATRVVYPHSRLVADPERFLDDEQEPMAKHGLGAVYLQRMGGGALRRPISGERRAELIESYLAPFHQEFESAVQAALDEHGRCLIVDCHSFPAEPLSYEPLPKSSSDYRPEICIGTDPFHTLEPLAEAIEQLAWDKMGYDEDGWEPLDVGAFEEGEDSEPSPPVDPWLEDESGSQPVRVNWPFAGTIVPLRHYGKNRLVQSVMIEVRRDLYWDDAKGQPSERWAETKKRLGALLEKLASVDPFERWGGNYGQSMCPFCGDLSEGIMDYMELSPCNHKVAWSGDGCSVLERKDGKLIEHNFSDGTVNPAKDFILWLLGEYDEELPEDPSARIEELKHAFKADEVAQRIIRINLEKENDFWLASFEGLVNGDTILTGGMTSCAGRVYWSNKPEEVSAHLAKWRELFRWGAARGFEYSEDWEGWQVGKAR
jgi:N-formylglutamate deformylase